MSGNKPPNKHEFTLIFELPSEADDSDALIESLGEAGCTDALVGVGGVGVGKVGVGEAGSIALDFCRRGSSADSAMASAEADVLRAIPGASLIYATKRLQTEWVPEALTSARETSSN